jgi:hypothetical protein
MPAISHCPYRFAMVVAVGLIAFAGGADAAKPADAPITYQAPHATTAPQVDGLGDDPSWQQAPWRAIDQVLLGEAPRDASDFSGRYKAVWREDALYVLAEIHDDHLVDATPDPLQKYWEDDALEIFVDEDNSGGDHQHSEQAFAYHIALDNQAIDAGPLANASDEATPRSAPRTYPDHIQARWQRAAAAPHPLLWEVRVALYPADGVDVASSADADEAADSGAPAGTDADSDAGAEDTARADTVGPVTLFGGKRIGFMLAWCDSDVPGAGREHFIADVDVPPLNGDRNRGWLDADVFGVMELAPAK